MEGKILKDMFSTSIHWKLTNVNYFFQAKELADVRIYFHNQNNKVRELLGKVAKGSVATDFQLFFGGKKSKK